MASSPEHGSAGLPHNVHVNMCGLTFNWRCSSVAYEYSSHSEGNIQAKSHSCHFFVRKSLRH